MTSVWPRCDCASPMEVLPVVNIKLVDIGSVLPSLSDPIRALPAVFLGGVLTSLTPCIYPMIPITAAIVGGTSVAAPAEASRRRPVALTLTYVFGLALVY